MRYTSCFLLFIFLSLSHFASLAQNVQVIDSLQLVLEKTKDPSLKVNLLLKISNQHRQNDPDKALLFANQAYELAVENDDYHGIHESLVKLILVYNKLGNYKKSLDLANQAKDFAESHNSKKELASANFWIANSYRKTGQYEKSLDYVFESLNLYEELNDKPNIARSLNGIGRIYMKVNESEKALEYFLRSHKIKTELSEGKPIIGELDNIGTCYFNAEEYEKALRYYIEALEINQGKKQVNECVYRNNIANCYRMLVAYDLAIENYLEANKIANEIQYNSILLITQINLAQVYLITNEPEKSKAFALKAYKNSQEFNMLYEMRKATAALRDYYLFVKDTAKAYNYAVIEYQLKDSLNISKSQQKIAQLEITNEFEKRNQEILREKDRDKFTYIFIGAISIIVFITILAILYIRQKNKDKCAKLVKSKMENELKTRNKELAINVMSLMKKNEMLTGLSKELYEVKQSVKEEETKKVINRIARKIKSSSETEIWEEFELRFKQVHGEFYKNLLKNYPDLTPSEQKLCAFLKLNMSSKDISELTGQSLSSIDKARYRLRKKLHIKDSHTNLTTFITKI